MPPRYDILLKNATVVDPVNDRNAVLDVAVAEAQRRHVTSPRPAKTAGSGVRAARHAGEASASDEPE